MTRVASVHHLKQVDSAKVVFEVPVEERHISRIDRTWLLVLMLGLLVTLLRPIVYHVVPRSKRSAARRTNVRVVGARWSCMTAARQHRRLTRWA